MLFDDLVFLGLASFAGVLIPGSLEVALTIFLYEYANAALIAWVIVTIFNILGCVVIFLLGSKIPRKKRIPSRITNYIEKYGTYSMLLAGIPVVGDVLPIAAGWLRLPLMSSMFFLLIGKAVRYGLTILFLEFVVKNI